MQQTAFLFESSDAHDQNEYIISTSNSLAYHTINDWPDNWGVTPYPRALILSGPNACGKTFLAKKWAAKTGALFIKPSHELTENILAQHSAFIVDEFDDEWDEEKLLHHFNTIHENHKHLLITSTKPPKISLPDLASRIKATNRINISMPDDELMKMLIFKLFSNYSVVISNEVISYLVKALPRDFPSIIASIKLINEFALEHQRKITVPLVKECL